jgi:hypothetical protein
VKKSGLCLAWCAFLAAALVTSPARATNTSESWGIGATDIDYAFNFHGLGAGKSAHHIATEMLYGYGINGWFNAYMGLGLEGNTDFLITGTSPFMGVFATVVNTDHFDMDLWVSFRSVVESGEFHLAPGLELNFNADPNMQTWGLYMRVASTLGPSVSADARPEAAASLDLDVGAYTRLGRPHRLLLEYRTSLGPFLDDNETRVDHGSIVLGYNVILSKRVEILSHIITTTPQDDRPWSVGMQVGFIATLPSVPEVALSRQ